MSAEEHAGVRVADEGPIRVVTLDKPATKNALDLAMRPVIADAIEEANRRDDLRAVVVTGANGAFCSGGDVTIMRRMSPEEMRPRMVSAQRIVRAIVGGHKPVVAAVEGPAFAAGFGLALACDVIVAAEDALFTASFTSVGFAADLGLTWTLPRRVGWARARQLMMANERLSGAEALAAGVVDLVAPKGEVLGAAIAAARRYAAGPPLAYAFIKHAYAEPAPDLETALQQEIDIQSALADTEDFAEGVTAFRERRRPDFRGV